MKRVSKKIGAIILALAMCMSLCCTALAASSDDSNFTITVSNAYAGKTYSAYKIFDATYDDNGNVAYSITSDSQMYSYVIEASYTTESATYDNPFTFKETSDGKYTVTVTSGFTDTDIVNFLNAMIASIPDEELKSLTAAASETADANGTLVLDVSDSGAGYYFVTSSLGSVVSITTTEPDGYIIEKNNPPGDLHKYVVEGTEEDGTQHGDTEAVGDDVDFQITANVPLYAPGDEDCPEGYLVTDYEFIDNMSAGLEIRDLEENVDYTISTDDNGVDHYYATEKLINEWIKIYDGTTDSEGNPVYYSLTDVAFDIVLELTDVSVYDDDGDGVTDGIQFDGFTLSYTTIDLNYYENNITHDDDGTAVGYDNAYELVEALRAANACNYPTNATIEIDYTAHVTGGATYDEDNEIDMAWHMTPYRNPNPLEPEYNGGDRDEDDIYILQLEVLKVDGSDLTNVLAGAEFQLSGTNLQDVVTNTHEEYTSLESYEEYQAEKAAGTELWFKLTDGKYTTVDPYTLDPETDADTLAKYEVNPWYDPENGDPYGVGEYEYVAYTMTVEYSSTVQPADETTKTVTGVTDENGVLIFKGLTVGEWTLTEITAPDGYNLLPDDFTLTIGVTWSVDNVTGKIVPTWTITGADSSLFNLDQSTGVISITVENNAGTELPSTGGIGTTIFYIIGGVLVVGAVVVLVTRRRVHREA